jgi:hypothetical protein
VIDWAQRVDQTCNLKSRRASNGLKFYLSKTAIWEFRRHHPRTLFFKYSLLDDEPFKTVSFARYLRDVRHQKIKASKIPNKYEDPIPLKAKKYDSLQKLSRNLHRQEARNFYRDLPTELDSESDSSSSEDSDCDQCDSDDLEPFLQQCDQYLPDRFDEFQVTHSYDDQRKVNAEKRRLMRKKNLDGEQKDEIMYVHRRGFISMTTQDSDCLVSLLFVLQPF